jgi:hypothetical protein
MDEDIVAILMMGLVGFTLVAGLMLRLALKPLVDSIARLLEVRAGREHGEVLEQRVALLEQELNAVRGELGELRERDEFYRRLGPGAN